MMTFALVRVGRQGIVMQASLRCAFTCIAAFVAAPAHSTAPAARETLAHERQQRVFLGNGSEPKELDPSTATGVPEAHILDNLFEGLTTLDPLTLEPEPGVAEAWTISGDGRVYTFALRRDARWSDGTPLVAGDFVAAWLRTLAPATASEYSYQLYYVKNGKAFNSGQLKDASQVGVTAQGKHTLVVTLENPTPFFLRLTAFHTLYPTPRHTIARYPDKEWTREGKMVSNGPFKLAEWQLNKHIKLIPNEHYWDRDRIKIKEAFFLPIENADTEEKSFFAGELHLTSQVPLMKVPTYKREQLSNPGQYHPYKVEPYLGIYYFRFNTTKKPLNDKRVRQALAMTVDRKLLTERVTQRGELPAGNFTPPGVGGYTYDGPQLAHTVTPELIKRAKDLLKSAGYPDGQGMPKIEVLYNTSENHKKIVLALQQMWKKNLGIEVGLFNQEWKVYLDTQRSMNYDISRAGWIGDYPDPNTFLDLFVKDGGNNQTGWARSDYDDLITKAASTSVSSERWAYFQQAEAILVDEVPVLPLYVYTQAKLVSPKLKIVADDGGLIEWRSNLTERILLKYIALAE